MNPLKTSIHALPVLLIYLSVCFSANLLAQNPQNYPSAEAYADTMMQTQEAWELYEAALSQPTDSMSQEEQEADAWMYVETYYKAEWYAAMHQCTYTNDEMCYNGDFELSGQNDSNLEGFCLYDGIRKFGISNCDYTGVPFLPLPEGVVPDPADAPNNSYLFDLNPNNNGPIFQLDLEDQDPANFHSFELFIDEDDAVIPNLISTTPPSGNPSIKINNTHNQYHINMMKREFKVNPATSTYFFSMAFVMEDPQGHPADRVPFASALARGPSGQVIDQVCYIADKNNTSLNVANVSGYSPIVFRDWGCEQFDLSEYVDSTVTVEFTASDCGYGAHFGYMYIADICRDCSDLPDITLDSAYFPCPKYPLEFCGEYTFPDSVYNLIDITWEIQNMEEGVIYEDSLTSNPTDSTYCFAVDQPIADSIGMGSYDVYSIMTLVDTVGGDTMNYDTVEIRSLSSNQNTQFSQYNDFIVGSDSCTDFTLDSAYHPCPEFPLQFCGEYNLQDSIYEILDITWKIEGEEGIVYQDTNINQTTDSTFCFRIYKSIADSIGEGNYDVEAMMTVVDTTFGDTSMYDTLNILSGTANPNSESEQFNDFIIGNEDCCPTEPIESGFSTNLCLVGEGYDEKVMKVEGHIPVPDGYEACGFKPDNVQGGYFTFDDYIVNPINGYIQFSGWFNITNEEIIEQNDNQVHATIDLCSEEDTCSFDLQLQLHMGTPIMCGQDGFMCNNFLLDWQYNSPYESKGVVTNYFQVMFPFLTKLNPDTCEINEYNAEIEIKFTNSPGLVFYDSYTFNAPDNPYNYVWNSEVEIPSNNYDYADYMKLTFWNNCGDTCMTTLDFDPIGPRSSFIEENESLEVYPNPVDNQLTVNVPAAGKFKLLNLAGSPVYNSRMKKGDNSVGLNDLPPGLYFIDFRTENGKRYTERVVVME